MRDFVIGHIVWGVTSVFAIFVSHRSSALLRVIHLMAFVTQLTAVLNAGSPISCHNFLSLCFCFNSRSKPERSVFTSEIVILLVDNLYADAIETMKPRAALSASTPVLISNLGDIKSEARLWNRSQSVNFSLGSERFLILTWSSMWIIVGKWSESKILETVTWKSDILVNHCVQYVTISRNWIMGGALWCWNFELSFVEQFQKFFTWGVWNRTVPKWMLSIQITCQNCFSFEA
jgi:hypothetical protein